MNHIAWLRGINVGGHNKIKMADLKKSFERCGFKNVRTYIQSGNVAFESDEKETQVLSQLISKVIMDDFSLEVEVIVQTFDGLVQRVKHYPYLDVDETAFKKRYITFLVQTPSELSIAGLMSKDWGQDQLHVEKDVVYLLLDRGASQTKLDNKTIENHLGVKATTRNLKTCLSVLALFDHEAHL